jgi:hypothetical protein
MWGGMANPSGRVQEWTQRYLIAELAGLAAALVAAILAASWSPDRLAVVAYAGSLTDKALSTEVPAGRCRRCSAWAVRLAANAPPADPAHPAGLDSVLVYCRGVSRCERHISGSSGVCGASAPSLRVRRGRRIRGVPFLGDLAPA